MKKYPKLKNSAVDLSTWYISEGVEEKMTDILEKVENNITDLILECATNLLNHAIEEKEAIIDFAGGRDRDISTIEIILPLGDDDSYYDNPRWEVSLEGLIDRFIEDNQTGRDEKIHVLNKEHKALELRDLLSKLAKKIDDSIVYDTEEK